MFEQSLPPAKNSSENEWDPGIYARKIHSSVSRLPKPLKLR